MSQDTENTPDTGAAPDPTPEAATPKRTINRRPQTTRVLQHVKGDTWRMLPARFAGITEGEAHVEKDAAPGLYWVASGPDEAPRVNPRAVVPEALP